MANERQAIQGRPSFWDAWRLAATVGLVALPWLVVADRGLMAAVQAWQWPPLHEVMQAVTWLGNGGVDIGVPLVLAAYGWWRGDRAIGFRGLAGAATVAGAGLLDQAVKNVACRARPSAPLPGVFFTNFPCFPARYAEASFPSGHATTGIAVAVLLACWFPRQAGVFAGIAVLVGLSRVILGAHFPSDVLAGALLGSGVVVVAYMRVPALRGIQGATPAALHQPGQ